MTTDPASDGLHSVPALLARNAAQFGANPAYREKEFGIWQSWTWAETAEEIRAWRWVFWRWGSNGAIMSPSSGATARRCTGRWSPRRWCGAVPVPLYQDAVAEEMAYVLDHCGARFVICGDQEQVDKVIEVQDRVHQYRAHDLSRQARPAEIRPFPAALRWHDVQAEGPRGA